MFCKSACRPSNPATDSVRVDVSAIAGKQPDAAGQPSARTEEPAGPRAEELAQEQAEAEERRLEERRLEEERLEEERLAEERRLEEERLQQEEQALREQEERERLEREEEAKRREAERLTQEKQARERKQAVDTFCRQRGFEGPNTARQSGCTIWGATATYPIHVAAELGDASMTEMLIKEGADPAVKNSAGKTAAQAAQKKSKAGSHDAVRRILANSAGASAGGA